MRALLPLEVVRQADEAPVGLRDAPLLLRDRLLQEVMEERLAKNLIKATKTEKNLGKTMEKPRFPSRKSRKHAPKARLLSLRALKVQRLRLHQLPRLSLLREHGSQAEHRGIIHLKHVAETPAKRLENADVQGRTRPDNGPTGAFLASFWNSHAWRNFSSASLYLASSVRATPKLWSTTGSLGFSSKEELERHIRNVNVAMSNRQTYAL